VVALGAELKHRPAKEIKLYRHFRAEGAVTTHGRNLMGCKDAQWVPSKVKNRDEPCPADCPQAEQRYVALLTQVDVILSAGEDRLLSVFEVGKAASGAMTVTTKSREALASCRMLAWCKRRFESYSILSTSIQANCLEDDRIILACPVSMTFQPLPLVDATRCTLVHWTMHNQH
jgi:hypothetical protein